MRLVGYATIAAAAMGLMLTHALPAAAATFDVHFGGFINSDPSTTFSVEVHFERSTPDLNANPTTGSYNAISDLHGSVTNGLTFSTTSPIQNLLVQNNVLFIGLEDHVFLETLDVTGSGFTLGGNSLAAVAFDFCCNISMLSSDGIPDFSTLLAGSDQHPFVFTFGAVPFPHAFLGTITSVSVAPVAATPVPATLSLFASALGGLGVVGWRRRKHQAA